MIHFVLSLLAIYIDLIRNFNKSMNKTVLKDDKAELMRQEKTR